MQILKENGVTIAVISGDKPMITDVQSALDLAMTVRYEADTGKIAICKEAIAEEFFILSTGMAGEILQKFVNYQMQVAVWGDYSRYTSKPLQDFIRESNQGKHFFFVATREEAVERLQSETANPVAAGW